MKISRKTLLAVVGVVGAILTVFQETFGLGIDAGAFIAGLTSFLLYIFWEYKADIVRLKEQAGRFKDPKFWLTILSAVLVAVSSGFSLNLPVEIIIGVLTAIVGVIFKVQKS